MSTESDNPQGTATQTAVPTAAELFASEIDDDQPEQEADDDAEATQGEGEADESDAPEGEEGDEADPDEEGESEASDKKPETIEIDGKPVNLEEVKLGYLRQQDYTRKTQQLSTERQEFDAAIQRVTQIDQSARQALDLAKQVISSVIPQAPSMDLLQSDPVAYFQAKEAHDLALNVIKQLDERGRTTQQAMTREQVMKRHDDHQKALEKENEMLIEKLPYLATSDGKERFRREAVEYGAKHYGLTAAEINSISSAKELSVLADAISYRKLKDKTPQAVQKVAQAPKMVKPGTREKQPVNRIERLQKLGGKATAADIFSALEG